MGVRKYRSVADMPPASLHERLDPENLRRACDVSRLASQLRPRNLVPGVRKYRSVGDADRMRLEWERAADTR